MFALFVAFLLTAGVSSSDRCETKSPKCTCDVDGLAFDCVGAGLEFDELGLRLDATKANITGNDFPVLSGGFFDRLTALNFLALSGNKITSLGPTLFRHNQNLNQLYLSNNLLTSLPSTLFSMMSQLTLLDCSYNNLTYIDSSLLSGLTNLKRLYLHENQISKIEAAAFRNFSLTLLFLENNRLHTAHWKWIKHFQHQGDGKESFELYFDGNPWSCDCRMARFFSKVQSHSWIPAHAHGSSRSTCDRDCPIELPVCEFPDKLRGKPLLTLGQDDFVCSPPIVTSQNNCTKTPICDVTEMHFDEGVPVVVNCSGRGIPIPLVQIRDDIGRNMTSQNEGHVSVTFPSATIDQAGQYKCVIQGYEDDGKAKIVTQIIKVFVRKTSSPALAVFLTLFILAVATGAGYAFYRFRLKRRAGYGSLGKDPDVHYEATNEPITSQSTPLQTTYSDDDVTNIVQQDEEEFLV
ncbi:unnamed protein product [Clavelina lepadiformis]|uniref:LRRCT domain-containing protein n=1 Tax=Clavelina lepadiformis TaxID=159417 RepID=A0ABP0FWV3_CLALP